MNRTLAILISLAAGCDRGGFSVAGDSGGDAQLGPPVDVHVTGKVTATNGPVAGAMISLRGASGAPAAMATSDATGAFVLDGTVPATRNIVLDASTTTHAPSIVLVPLQANVTSYTTAVKLTALTSMPAATTGSLDIPIVLMGRMAHVIVPAAQAGARVRVAAIDPNDSPPGVLRPAGAMDEALQSVGMFYFDLVDAAGAPLQAPAGTRVELAAYTPPAIPDAQGFKSWRLDNDGEWAEGVAIDMSMSAAAPPMFDIDQIGYWNADRNFRTACVRGTLVKDTGACAGASVKSTGPDGISSSDASKADGEFCVMGAQTFPAMLSIAGGPSRSVQMPSNPGDCRSPATCTDIGTITVDKSVCGDGDSVACSSVVTAGGDTPESHTIQMGKKSGAFTFSYDMASIKDRMVVKYQGATLYDTGCAAGVNTVPLSFSGASAQITVDIMPNCAGGTSGTYWEFMVDCPP